ncbi:MAG: hypothetical protein ACXVEK_14660 [Nocardioides sp.]
MQILDRPTLHLVGASLTADLAELPSVVPALWRQVFAGAPASAMFAELSGAPDVPAQQVTVGLLVQQPAPFSVEVPGGPWLHHRHTGPLADIGATYTEMETLAREAGIDVTQRRLDVGYRADGRHTPHDLFLQLV